MPLPPDLPERFTGLAAWTAADMADETRWLYTLSADEISELEAAAAQYLALGRDIGEISADAFPLSGFATHLAGLRAQLLHGIGVEVIRGLRVARYDQRTAAAIFCGIGAHLGSARSQNAAGHVLGHVRDIGRNPDDPNARIYQTAARQTFHTDSADVVGLLCLRDAAQGGDSLLVSALSICNAMRARRLDLLALLFDRIATDRRGEIPDGAEPYMTIPPLSWHAGHLTVFYQRQYIDSAQRFEGAMRLTPAHIEALDLFDALANDPALHVQMRLQPGEFIRNLRAWQIKSKNRCTGVKQSLNPYRTQFAQGTRYDGNFIL